MAAEQFVNVTYRGLELGRRLRVAQFGPTTAYLEHPTPMPVGTELAIHSDDGVDVAVRVLRVQEQVAGADNPPGMRVAAGALDDLARDWWDGLVTASDPTIPEPGPDAVADAGDEAVDAAAAEAAEVAAADEHDTQDTVATDDMQAQADAAAGEDMEAQAQPDTADDAGGQDIEAASESAVDTADGQAESELVAAPDHDDGGDSEHAETVVTDDPDAVVADGVHAGAAMADDDDTASDARADVAADQADQPDVQAADDDDDGGDVAEAGSESREGAPTEKMSAAEIQALIATDSELAAEAGAPVDAVASVEPDDAGDESPERGRADTSSDASDDSSSRGRKRRRGRRRARTRG